MRLLITGVLFCAAASAQIPQSLGLSSGQSVGISYSNLNLNVGRFEFRIHDFVSPSSTDYVLFTDNLHCYFQPGSLVLYCTGYWLTQPGGYPFIDLTNFTLNGHTDARVRFQFTGTECLMEVWKGDGSGYVSSSRPCTSDYAPAQHSGSNSLGGNGSKNIAFFRWYSTTIAANSPPPAEAPATIADIMDFTFDGTLVDRANRYTATMSSGNAVYIPSYQYPPYVGFTQWGTIPYRTFRTSASLPLVSTAFTSVGTGVPSSYFWQQLAGPATGQFTTRTGATTAFSSPIAGDYLVQLTASDPMGNSASASVHIGAVATDQNGIVITGNAALDRLIGPHLIWGESPWLYHDWGEMALAQVIGEQGALANPPNAGITPISGTVSFVNGGSGSVLNGNGTHFTTDLAPSNCGGQNCYLYARFQQYGRTINTYLGQVQSISSDTSGVSGGQYYWWGPTTTATLLIIGNPNTPNGWGTTAYASNYNYNYYDPFTDFARLAVRTGLSEFWDDLDTAVPLWHDWGIAGGYNNPVPRVTSWMSVMVEALRGHPELWNFAHWWLYTHEYQNPYNAYAQPGYDLREFSYIMLHAANASLVDSDPGRHADYCTVLDAWNDALVNGQNSLGYWPQTVYIANPSYPFQTSVTFPWHMDIAAEAMAKAYESYTNATYGCNDPVRAVSLKGVMQKAIDFMWNYGRNTVVRGPHYFVMSVPDGEQRSGNSPGSVSWSGAGSIITGSGTSFNTATVTDDDGVTRSVCDGNHYIALDSILIVAQIASCQSATQLTVSTPLTGSAFSGGTYFLTQNSISAPACNSQAPTCGLWDQDEARIMPAGFGWWAGNFGGVNANGVSYLSQADEWFSAAFGGPSDGPGGMSTDFGPNGNGYQSDWTSNLYSCAAVSPPCSAIGAGPDNDPLGKNWGQGSGAVGAQTELAWRLGGFSAPVNRTVSVGFNLSSVPGATGVTLTVTKPDGTQTQTSCSVSPCQLVLDHREGTHLVTTRYVSSSGSTLRTSDPLTIPVY